jgi:hypothetical protein
MTSQTIKDIAKMNGLERLFVRMAGVGEIPDAPSEFSNSGLYTTGWLGSSTAFLNKAGWDAVENERKSAAPDSSLS